MEYQLFYQEQPFGLWREDYRAAQIAYMLAVVNSTKHSRPTLDEFMPFFRSEHREDENEDDGVADYLANR